LCDFLYRIPYSRDFFKGFFGFFEHFCYTLKTVFGVFCQRFQERLFILTLLFLLLVFYILKRLTTSPYGILVRSIKEDENRVRFLGYNTYFYKWLTFVIASLIAGLAGTLTALNYRFVNPNVMDVHQNVGVVFACLIGGAGNLYGAIIGGVAYMMISNYLAIYIHRWEMFLGISLLIIVFRFRKGIWGSIQNMGEYFQRTKEIRPAEEKRS